MLPELHEYSCSQGMKAKKIIAVVLIAALLGVPYLISLHKPTVLLLTNHFNYLVSSRHENHQIPTAAAPEFYVSLRRRRIRIRIRRPHNYSSTSCNTLAAVDLFRTVTSYLGRLYI
jgi:hypothetical protein